MTEPQVLLTKLSEIHQVIKEQYKQEPHIGVLAGIAGMALFEFYYAKVTDNDEYAELGLEILSHALDKINDGYPHPSFSSGMAGLGWVMDHLSIEGFLEDNNDETLPALDEYLYETMIGNLETGNFDYLHGGIGYGMYFLNRYKASADAELKASYVGYLAKLLEHLDRLAEKEGELIKWVTDLPQSHNPASYDFSHSHGMSGVANFLSRLDSIPSLQQHSKPLLAGVLKYFLQHKSTEASSNLFFPVQIRSTGINRNGRVAWCYGDLGPGFAFDRAAEVLQKPDYKTLAAEIFIQEANKRDPKITHVLDSGFCHGSFGNAHIFNRLFKETGHSAFEQSANFWLQDGLDKANFEDGLAGFKQWNPMTNDWANVSNLLEGIAGIGLVMIDKLSPTKNQWDELFLLS